MTEREQIEEARVFSAQWNNQGDEISDTIKFWIGLIRVLGITDRPENFFDTQQKVEINGHVKRIDAIIPSTKVLIEQKSFGVDLDKKYLQSDGENLTPFEQAKRYAEALDYQNRPRWIVTCNFKELWIYDLKSFEEFKRDFSYFWTDKEHLQYRLSDDMKNLLLCKPIKVSIERLIRDYKQLNFLVDPNDDKIKPEVQFSTWAAEIISKILQSFKSSYEKSKLENYSEMLTKLCVRLVFCLYAEDADIFQKNQFHDYLKNFKTAERGEAIQNVFKILNQPKDERDQNLDDSLKNFPYVNGKLFEDENFIMPDYNGDIDLYLFTMAMVHFDWRGIDPIVFGAMFESVLNDDVRREGGMHYTSVNNIKKVIDPLFLNDLNAEFEHLKRSWKDKVNRLKEFHEKLASLRFLDPACGSGNFLTTAYVELRKLENEVIREIRKTDDSYSDIKVSIHQFYGIEINDFAVAVAKTALWIAESQMMQETEIILHKELNFLPLKDYDNIIKANALQIDWNSLIDKAKLNYIIGNPPFVGYTYQTAEQKKDLLNVTGLNTKKIDYVACWYFKAADFIQGTEIRCAFVSTNSICQGEQVSIIWHPLFEKIHIDFAYRTFKWLSESEKMAAVHCVIIGFSAAPSKKPKIIFDGEQKIEAKNINAYLVDAENIFIDSRNAPICDVPMMIYGNKPAEGQKLIIETEEYEDFVKHEPKAKKFIHQLVGAEEFINNKKRYCLWLVGVSIDEIIKMPLVVKRVDDVIRFRLASKKAATRADANRPTEFQEVRQPTTDYIIIPAHSGGERKYIPIGFVSPDIIATNAVHIIPNAELYHFGILTSIVHMAWTRTVCGRLKSDYRYSKEIVYNNFPWCNPSYAQKKAIEETALDILLVRKSFKKRSLADLYDQYKMPDKLRKAHQANDRAVMDAYGFNESMTESEIVAALMKMYQKLTST